MSTDLKTALRSTSSRPLTIVAVLGSEKRRGGIVSTYVATYDDGEIGKTKTIFLSIASVTNDPLPVVGTVGVILSVENIIVDADVAVQRATFPNIVIRQSDWHTTEGCE